MPVGQQKVFCRRVLVANKAGANCAGSCLLQKASLGREAYKSSESLCPSLKYKQRWRPALALLASDVLVDALAPRINCLVASSASFQSSTKLYSTPHQAEFDRILQLSSSLPFFTVIQSKPVEAVKSAAWLLETICPDHPQSQRQAIHAPSLWRSPKQSGNVEVHRLLPSIGQQSHSPPGVWLSRTRTLSVLRVTSKSHCG